MIRNDLCIFQPFARHSFCTRLLFSVFPAQCYAKKDASIFGLLEALAADCKSLFEDGVHVSGQALVYQLIQFI